MMKQGRERVLNSHVTNGHMMSKDMPTNPIIVFSQYIHKEKFIQPIVLINSLKVKNWCSLTHLSVAVAAAWTLHTNWVGDIRVRQFPHQPPLISHIYVGFNLGELLFQVSKMKICCLFTHSGKVWQQNKKNE